MRRRFVLNTFYADRGPGTSSPGRIEYREQSLKDLLFLAYRVQFFQLETPS